MGNFFPFFIDIGKKRFLLIGGGEIAWRRVSVLIRFNPEIKIISKNINAEIKNLDYNKLCFEEREFRESDLEGADFVLALTDDRELNAKIAKKAKEMKIPVNDCSNKENCDFYFPGIAGNDKIVIGICAGGVDHRLAARTTAYIKERIEPVLGLGEEVNVKKSQTSENEREHQKAGQRDKA